MPETDVPESEHAEFALQTYRLFLNEAIKYIKDGFGADGKGQVKHYLMQKHLIKSFQDLHEQNQSMFHLLLANVELNIGRGVDPEIGYNDPDFCYFNRKAHPDLKSTGCEYMSIWDMNLDNIYNKNLNTVLKAALTIVKEICARPDGKDCVDTGKFNECLRTALSEHFEREGLVEILIKDAQRKIEDGADPDIGYNSVVYFSKKAHPELQYSDGVESKV
jgi:hypothetical protein